MRGLISVSLKLIQAIYSADNTLKDLSPDERLKQRQKTVAPLVDAYFEWVKATRPKVYKGSKTDMAMQYSLNQEKYLRVFLTDGEVPIDNNGALSEGITYPKIFLGSSSDSGLPEKICA